MGSAGVAGWPLAIAMAGVPWVRWLPPCGVLLLALEEAGGWLRLWAELCGGDPLSPGGVVAVGEAGLVAGWSWAGSRCGLRLRCLGAECTLAGGHGSLAMALTMSLARSRVVLRSRLAGGGGAWRACWNLPGGGLVLALGGYRGWLLQEADGVCALLLPGGSGVVGCAWSGAGWS